MRPFGIFILVLLFNIPALAQNASTKSGAYLTCLDQGWSAFNKSSYAEAIEHVNRCIDDFQDRAMRDQKQLEKDRAPEPPTGEAGSENKREIFRRSILNDVATAYFVKGRAAEALYQKSHKSDLQKLAIASYEAAAKLTYARCWDPQGWFWSPAEAATEQLDALKRSLK